MTELTVGKTVLLENNGPVGLAYGTITKIWEDDGRHKDFINVETKDQDSTPLALFKIPKKVDRSGRDITPSWQWFCLPDSQEADDA